MGIERGIALADKLALIDRHWAPGIVTRVNDYEVKVARLLGSFTWHSHPDTDELFLVLHGQLTIELRDRVVELQRGELYVVPRATQHRPLAEQECHVLLFERAGTSNTGDNPGTLTHNADWL